MTRNNCWMTTISITNYVYNIWLTVVVSIGISCFSIFTIVKSTTSARFSADLQHFHVCFGRLNYIHIILKK